MDTLVSGSSHLARDVAPTTADSLALALRGLPVAARALMVGVHPDDEDSALLAELALRHGVRTVYLSLTRGEGGQNRIGPESGATLGILRTGELLAARHHDGAEQLLGPHIDFGYARNAEAAFAQWGRERMIGTVVQAIREVQPDVLISIWTGTPVDGHGHHQACGITTHEAFERASDAAAFPEHLQAGLAPWQPRRLLVRVRDVSRQRAGDIHINVGRWDPVLERSCFEIAMQGRSLHRSQNMGALQPKGSQHVTYRVVAGTPIQATRDPNLLSGLPLRLDAWMRAHLGQSGKPIFEAVDTATRLLEDAWFTFHPQRPDHNTASILLKALRTLRRAAHLLDCAEKDESQEVSLDFRSLRDRLQERIRKVASVWTQAGGISLEVFAHQPQVVAGESFEVETELFIRGAVTTRLLSLQMDLQPGWRAECLAGPEVPMILTAGDSVQARFLVTVSADEETAVSSTLPPWLCLPSDGYLYRFPGPLPSLAPCAPPLLAVQATVKAEELQIPIVAPLMYRESDPGFGEVRYPVRVLPSVLVDVAPNLMVMPASAMSAPSVTVMLRSQKPEPGRLVLRDMNGGRQERRGLSLHGMGRQTVRQALPVDIDFRGKRAFRLEWERLAASPAAKNGSSYYRSVQHIRYPHVEPGYLLVPAQLAVTVVSAEVVPDLTIGYVPGTDDAVPQALAALGMAVEMIDDTCLQFGNLEKFDTIVVGVRALETRPLVAANRQRLWNYARSGGTIIVQYQKPREDGPTRFVPFVDVSMPRPVPRVSQKKASVRLLAPDDPLFTFPNRIGPEDFAGWVQERGLYFLATWPQEMLPLLESADAGDTTPRRGGLLRARLGKGHYVYCAYALFRQLPAGVPGAYRLLANLVSLSKSPAYRK